jgi:predicted RNA-binding protein with PUA domain
MASTGTALHNTERYQSIRNDTNDKLLYLNNIPSETNAYTIVTSLRLYKNNTIIIIIISYQERSQEDSKT